MNEDNTLHRVDKNALALYDNSYNAQISSTGGRVDTSARQYKSTDLYATTNKVRGMTYIENTLKKIDRQKSMVDIDPRAFNVASGTKRFFRANDLYVVPANFGGTGSTSFVNSITNTSLQSKVRSDAGKGGPIRLPNLPFARGIGADFNRGLSSDIAVGYLKCMTVGQSIVNGGLVHLASAPSEIQDSVSVNTTSDTAVGSSQGFDLFSDVGTRQVTFSFEVYADYLPYPFTNVRDYCLALKQMNYPTYSSMQVNSPNVLFEYGGIKIRGIPTITFSYANTIKKGVIDKASISVQIIETEAIINGTARI